MIKFMLKFVNNIKTDESLSGFLKNKAQENKEYSSGSPKDYFFLTSLCDPMNDFIKKRLPKQEVSLESKKRIERGNKLHAFAKVWFQNMKGYESSDATLDGIYFGLPVIGKIDAKINKSIIELKTKENIPKNPQEIIETCPGDLEQLGFYTVLDPTKPIENYLVFLSHGYPQEIKAFKVKIRNHNSIRWVLKKRIDDLTKALKENDPSILGRCRYCDEECSLKEDKHCKWFDLPKKECEISDYVKITEDDLFANLFKEAMKSWESQSPPLFISNILSSRKYIYKNVLELEDPFEETAESTKNKDYIKKLVFEFKKSYEHEPVCIPSLLFPEIYISKNNWINRISSKSKSGELLPFIACVSDYSTLKVPSSPPQYKLAELGIMVCISNKPKGLIFIYYPKINDGEYKVFEVEYSFDESCKKKIEHIINILKLKDAKLISDLPPCPFFMHDKCNFKEICAF